MPTARNGAAMPIDWALGHWDIGALGRREIGTPAQRTEIFDPERSCTFRRSCCAASDLRRGLIITDLFDLD